MREAAALPSAKAAAMPTLPNSMASSPSGANGDRTYMSGPGDELSLRPLGEPQLTAPIIASTGASSDAAPEVSAPTPAATVAAAADPTAIFGASTGTTTGWIGSDAVSDAVPEREGVTTVVADKREDSDGVAAADDDGPCDADSGWLLDAWLSVDVTGADSDTSRDLVGTDHVGEGEGPLREGVPLCEALLPSCVKLRMDVAECDAA